MGRSHAGTSAPDFLPAKEPAGAPATILGTGPSPAGAGGAPSETTSPVPSTTAPRWRSNDGFTALPYGTTISAMRFAATLIARGHVVRVVACGEPGDSTGQMPDGPEMFYVPELVVPVASHLARRQNTVFGKPVRNVLIAAIEGADVVHIYQPWPLGRAAERIARQLGVPAIAAFHMQPENVTHNIDLGWFPPAARFVYVLLRLAFYGRFADIHRPSVFIAMQLRHHGYRARLHVISSGIDRRFRPGPARVRGADEPFRVIMVGRFSPEKRQDVLIRAVTRSRYAARIQLHFAGRGPWEKRLRRMAANLANPAQFGHYSQEELIELLRSCDLYVHTSDVEIEGLSCSTCVCGRTRLPMRRQPRTSCLTG